MRSILVDLKTGQVFSEEHGWNYAEASIREDWSRIIHVHTSPIISGKKRVDAWKKRTLLCVLLPMEPEILT